MCIYIYRHLLSLNVVLGDVHPPLIPTRTQSVKGRTVTLSCVVPRSLSGGNRFNRNRTGRHLIHVTNPVLGVRELIAISPVALIVEDHCLRCQTRSTDPDLAQALVTQQLIQARPRI